MSFRTREEEAKGLNKLEYDYRIPLLWVMQVTEERHQAEWRQP